MGRDIQDIQQLYDYIEGLFNSLKDSPEINTPLLSSGITIAYELSDPEGRMLIDASGEEIKVYSGEWPAGTTPSITLTMSCDTCHQYWQGKVNFMHASFKGDVRTEGDLEMLLKLLPLATPLFKVYKEFLIHNDTTELPDKLNNKGKPDFLTPL